VQEIQRIGVTQLREELALITAKTLQHYDERAAEFWEGTRDHDVTQNGRCCGTFVLRASVWRK
jgi:hypothetical protein